MISFSKRGKHAKKGKELNIKKLLFIGGCLLIAIVYIGASFITEDAPEPRTELKLPAITEEITYDSVDDTIPPTEVVVTSAEPIRENTLYYIQDKGYRYDLKDEYQDYLWEECKKYGIEEYYELLLAQMYHESSFNPNDISSTNDYGLMQINVCNHKWLSGIIGDDDFLNPYTSIRAGVYLMSNYLSKYNDVQKALVCYNRGERAVINGTHTTAYSRGVIEDISLLFEK